MVFKVILRVIVALGLAVPFVECNEDVNICLTDSSSHCDADRHCEGVSFGNDRSCLATAIPWQIPHNRIKCCFRCCLYYWQKELGLDDIYEYWDRERREQNIPNAEGIKKHGWPKWDDVIFSHMTPFAWASTRRVSGAFLGGTSIQKDVQAQFEVAGPAVGVPGGFGMYEGGPPQPQFLDPSHSGAAPSVIVVGTDEWLGAGPTNIVKEYFVSNPKDVVKDCAGAPLKGQVHDLLLEWYKTHPHCTSPEEYFKYEHEYGSVHAFPRALQKTTGWDDLLKGGEAKSGSKRSTLLHCGASIKLRGNRGTILKTLKDNGFPCIGSSHTSLNEFVEALQASKLAWSPPGHGWSNHRETEIFLSGAIPVVEYHPNFVDFYKDMPVVQVNDWATLTPESLEKQYETILGNAKEFNMQKMYWPYWLYEFTKYMPIKSDRPPRVATNTDDGGGATMTPQVPSSSTSSHQTKKDKEEDHLSPPPLPPLSPPPPLLSPPDIDGDEFFGMDAIADEIFRRR